MMDIGLATVILLAALPVMGIAALLILVTRGGNPLFLQTRVCQDGRHFRMLKLRTMRADTPAPSTTPSDAWRTSAGKSPGDPRVTVVGRVMRRTSVDELPQLINVVLGQMSLVGPRPALPDEVALYPGSWRHSLTVKPGLTGLWQVCGRSELTPERRASLDRLYVQRRSVAYDCVILLRTASATISMRGAW